jgi:hypothetical protein
VAVVVVEQYQAEVMVQMVVRGEELVAMVQELLLVVLEVKEVLEETEPVEQTWQVVEVEQVLLEVTHQHQTPTVEVQEVQGQLTAFLGLLSPMLAVEVVVLAMVRL